MLIVRNAFARFGVPLIVASLYLFLYIPIAVLVIYSFNDAEFPAPWSGFSLRWYHEFFESAQIWMALRNSLVVSLSAVALSIGMSVLLVFLASRFSQVKSSLVLFYGSLAVPEIVMAVGLLGMFAFFNVTLGFPTLIAGHTVIGMGYAVPIIYSRFLEIDYRLTEASLDLGASETQTFFYIILPLLVPSMVASALLVFIVSLDDFLLSFFCAGSSTQTLSLYIFTMLRSGVSPVVNALSTLMLALSSLLVLMFCSLRVRTRIF